ncbi:helix-turn-helix transcriptional regulator [Marinobacterium marinum]|uniref:Helix-turn-helix transcriptional regulator n=1 Tax=Marinobacterium marinum TaxID=2756129 RepID=A0A7W2ADJ1_9GAMM|nr:AraC family transcriptional regulator [Marinobacterium marinum]MBA4503248.1 helix-turn-helix transcriptional regulator [Marinobacterium marinum]
MQNRYDSTPAEARIFTDQDLLTFGERYALDYRFPDRYRSGNIMRGQVEEFGFRSGMQLVYSNVQVMESYMSSSLDPAPLNIIIMLEGYVSLSLGPEVIELSEQMALTVSLDKEVQLDARQLTGQHLKVLTLSLDYAALELLQAPVQSGTGWHLWRLPPHLYQGLLAYRQNMDLSRLYLEGLSLQVLSHGLAQTEELAPLKEPRISPQERVRLEQIRDRVVDDPRAEYSLTDLSRLAAMSPSSLRSKFKACYGQTLFDFIKEQRLNMARDYLLQGFSVQQAAHFAGYSYATNFTTAFRKHFGVAPSSLIR